MQKYLITLLACISLQANAQIVSGNLEVKCSDEKLIRETLGNYEEVPIFKGHSLYTKQTLPVVLFSNLESGTWTLVQKNGNLYCVLASGVNLSINMNHFVPKIQQGDL
jgi:hypothetical protein